MSDREELPAGKTVNGQTFEELVAELRQMTTIESAIAIARLEFGLGGDTPVIDVTDDQDDTQRQQAANG